MELSKENVEVCYIALTKCLELEQSLTARLRIESTLDKFRCPICRKQPVDPTERTDARGRHWCGACITEFDTIDWEEVYRKQQE